MKKKVISSFVAAAVLALPSLNSVQAEEMFQEVGIEIDGVEQNFSQSAVLYNDITLVPLRGIFETLGIEVKWDGQDRKVTATKDTEVLELRIGSKQALKNYQPIPLIQEALIMNDRTMVPLRFISESFGANVDWDGEARTVKITSPPKEATASVITDKEEEASALPALTFADAYEKALSNSPKVRAQKVTIDQEEERRDKASDNLDYIPFGYGANPDDTAIRNAFTNLQLKDVNLRKAKKELEVQKQALFFQVKNNYNTILQATEKLQLSEKELELAKVQKNIQEQKAKLGLLSESDMATAENSFIEAQKQYKSAQDALTKAYDAFNQLVGYSLDKRFNLIDRPTYEEPFEDDVDIHVTQTLSDSIAVWLAEQNVRLAELGLDLYVFNDPTNQDTYTSSSLKVDQAEYGVSQQKKTLESTIRTTYHTIKELENSYDILKTKLADAKQTQKLMKARYDLGMIALVDLMQANLAVDTIKQNMFDIESQLELLKIQYEMPWLVGGGSNTGA